MTRHDGLIFAWTAAAAVLLSVLLRGVNLGQTPWFVSRAAGLVTFIALSLSVIVGLLISTKTSHHLVPKPFVYELHTFLSTLALGLVTIHVTSLLFDSFTPFTPLQLVVPFASPYRTFWTGLGVIAAWLSLLLVASFAVRRHIGYANWRKLHYLSFAAYLIGLLHGIGAGTDTALAPVGFMYLVSVATVSGLLAYRILGGSGAGAATPAPRPAPRSAPGDSNRAARRRALTGR